MEYSSRNGAKFGGDSSQEKLLEASETRNFSVLEQSLQVDVLT